MGQVTQVWTSYRLEKSNWETTCSSPIEGYTSMPYQFFEQIKNEPEHRERPENLELAPWDYLTPQAKQSTRSYLFGLGSNGPYIRGNYSCCYKCPPIPFWKQVWFYTQPGHTWDPEVRQYEESDWNQKLREKIKAHSTSLGESLAEYRQTADMFTRYAKGVASTWRALRTKVFPKHKFTTCDISSAWLAASWGLKPLADDLFNSAQRLNERLADPLYFKFRTGGNITSRFNENGHIGNSVSSDRGVFYVRFRPEGPPAFHVDNAAYVLYSIMPYSHVIDWGIPIGDWLYGLDALRYVDDIRGTLTRKWMYYHKYFPPYLDGVEGGYHAIRRGQVLHRTHERSLFIGGIPLPVAPRWDPSESWRKVAHSVSMLKQLRCRPKRDPRMVRTSSDTYCKYYARSPKAKRGRVKVCLTGAGSGP